MNIKKNEFHDPETEMTEGRDNVLVNAADSIVEDAVGMETEDERQRRQTLELLHSMRMDFHRPEPEEKYLLACDNHGFFAKGDIHAIKAKQKAGKTSAIMTLIAALLSGKCFRLERQTEECKVLMIDTEQKRSDTFRNYEQVFELAGLPKENCYDKLEHYSLRRLSMEDKVKSVETLIQEKRPDIVFIDGIVDLLNNFNEVEDSKQLIEFLMRLSAEYDCAIVCVLHTNKDTEDRNMRGHVGTMLGQRAGNVFECLKSNDGVITVHCSDSRHGDVPDWSIMYDGEGKLIDADEVRTAQIQAHREAIVENRKSRANMLFAERLEKVRAIISNNGGMMSQSKLRKAMKEGKILSRNFSKPFLDKCVEGKYLKASSDGSTYMLIHDDYDELQGELALNND